MIKNFKSLTLIAAMLIGMTAVAQSVTLNLEPQTKGIEHKFRLTYLGSNGQSVVFKQGIGLFFGTTEELVSYDLNQKEQGRVKLCNTTLKGVPEVLIRQVLVNGDKLDIIATTEKDNKYQVYHEQRDIVSLRTVGERKVLAEFRNTENDNIFCFTAQSPNHELVGVATVQLDKNMEASVRATLYSRQMEEYWSMDVPVHGFGSIMVTDDGDIVLSGISVKEGRASVQMSVTDGESSEKYLFSYPSNGELKEYEPTRYADGKLLLVATMREKSKYDIDCVDAITCDIKNNTVRRDRHSFTSEERSIIDNRRGDNPISDEIIYGKLEQTIGDKEGAFVVIDRTWNTYRDGSLDRHDRRGMMVLRVGNDGLFKWVRAERISSSVRAYRNNWIDYRWVPTSNGIMLAWTTNQNDIKIRETDKSVKGFSDFIKNANLSIVTLDRDGNVKQTDFNIGKQALFGQPWQMEENNWLVFVSNLKVGSFGRLKVEF